MATTSSEALSTQLRTRLLDYVPPAAAPTLRTRIGGRLYKDAAGDVTTFPYGIMRLLRDTSTDYSVVRETNQLEVMLFANRRTQAATLEDIADVCDMAMADYMDWTSGHTRTRRGRTRDTLPPPPAPADREVVQIRLLYDVVVYPLYLNQIGA